MKRGLLFSIEALISITLLVVIIGIIITGFGNHEIKNNYIEIQNQSKSAEVFYFGQSTSPANPDYNTIICEKIAYYDSGNIEKINTKMVCDGYGK